MKRALNMLLEREEVNETTSIMLLSDGLSNTGGGLTDLEDKDR